MAKAVFGFEKKPLAGKLDLGAAVLANGSVRFRVWAPFCHQVEVKVGQKSARVYPLKKEPDGYFSAEIEKVSSGEIYSYLLDRAKERPDPVSRLLPFGPHGPTAIVDPASYRWRDFGWRGKAYSDLIFYEMHTGLFTPQGTFEGAIKKISYLKKLGVTCVEIMPVAQFSGKYNWGYDGASLYAVQNSYGGPEGLKKFVDACHRADLAVCLDVVYNHLGPEGNYLSDFGPYFTSKYHTPWGSAVNYDDASSDEVRHYIIANARYWISEYHIDVLRLDAVHSIYDESARHILEEINAEVQKTADSLGRQVHVVAESDLNDPKIVRGKEKNGYGLAGQWSDDFHHSLHAFLTGESKGYYEDFGTLADIAKALSKGFVYDGQYSKHRKRRHGNLLGDLPLRKLVTCIQNHDQIGNRALGERLGTLIPWEKQKLAAFILLLSPNTPLLFMGQEYGETAPFQYFVDHQDENLRKAVREGRAKEFEAFGWKDIPDPSSKAVIAHSKLQWKLTKDPEHAGLLRLYKDLIALRKKYLPGAELIEAEVDSSRCCLIAEFEDENKQRLGWAASFSMLPQTLRPFSGRKLKPLLRTNDARYGKGQKVLSKKASETVDLAPFTAVFGKII